MLTIFHFSVARLWIVWRKIAPCDKMLSYFIHCSYDHVRKGDEMNFDMQKANLFADHIRAFVALVNKGHEEKKPFLFNGDRLFQVKLLVEDFQFQSLADELTRINMHTWDEGYTHLLAARFMKGLDIIDEFVNRNYEDLFLLSGRIHILKNLFKSLEHE